MLKPTPELAAFERRFAREVSEGRTYQEALRIFTALWAQARRINPHFVVSWQEDLAPDLRIARVLNRLPEDP